MNANRTAYRRIRFRPRVLRKVGEVDPSTEILGKKSSLPIWIAPCALAKLGHPLGEVNLTRGAGETGIMQVISSNSSCSLEELAAERTEGQELAWQLYVATDRDRAEKTIKKAFNLGMSSIWLTVDAPVGGNRERDTKEKIARDPVSATRPYLSTSTFIETTLFEQPKLGEKSENSGSTSAAQFSYVDPNLTWEDISWIKSLAPGKPLVIKGISCVEDAILAKEHGCQGIVLSNHGGRQLDGARPPIDVLQEIRRERPDLLKDMEVYVDGGIRRGTDVLKALCLGAKAVGLGRPFLYAQSAYGSDGVVKAVQSR
jgi:L-lactate dehydrogenase (cytochrome)